MEDGRSIALAELDRLKRMNRKLKEENEKLDKRNEELNNRVEDLEIELFEKNKIIEGCDNGKAKGSAKK